MGSIGLLIVGVICLIIAYYLPPSAPPPLRSILYIVGWICVAVGLILLLAAILGVPVGLGALR
jgi:hypothetical protein